MLYDELYEELCYILLEDDGLFSAVRDEVFIDRIYDAANEVLSDYKMVWEMVAIPVAIGQSQVTLPQSAVKAIEVFWNGVVLEKASGHQLALVQDQPMKTGTPQWWFDDTTEAGKIAIAPAPKEAGVVTVIYYIRLSDTTDIGFGKHIPGMPDCIASQLKWYVLSRLFAQDGEWKDIGRASYCLYRWNEVQAVLNNIIGWR